MVQMEQTGILGVEKVSTFITPGRGTSSDKKSECWLFEPEQIDAAWPDILPFIAKGLRFCRGEISTRNIYNFLLAGSMYAFAYVSEERINLVMTVEFVQYPQFHSARIVTLAGKGLKQAAGFMNDFENWCLLHGAVEIEAWVRPSIARLFHSQRLSFDPVYICVSRNLRSKLQ